MVAPAFGRGYGSYDHHSYRVLDSEILSRVVDTGIVGPLALVFMLVCIVSRRAAVINSRHPVWAPIALMVAAAAVAFLVLTFLFDVSSFPHTPYILMALAGLLAVVVSSDDEPIPRARRTRPSRTRNAGAAARSSSRTGERSTAPESRPKLSRRRGTNRRLSSVAEGAHSDVRSSRTHALSSVSRPSWRWRASSAARPPTSTATPATFASVWSPAQGGDRILLAAGSYGEFTGAASKASTVTILPQPGASASMSLAFNGASNIRVEGLTITDLTFQGPTRNVTVANSTFTGQAVIRTDQMVNANVVLDGNTHANISVGGCGDCYEGRIQVAGAGAARRA